MLVRIRKSQSDQELRSEIVAVPYSALSSTCPVRMTLSATRRARSGPLFRHIDRHRKAQSRLRSGAVSRIVKSGVADVLQLDPALYDLMIEAYPKNARTPTQHDCCRRQPRTATRSWAPTNESRRGFDWS